MKSVFKNLLFWVFLAIAGSAGALLSIHWQGIQNANERIAKIEPLYERQIVLSQLSLSLEQYRRAALAFRTLDTSQITEIKNDLKGDFSKGLNELDLLRASSEDILLSQTIRQKLDDFFKLSAKYEPTLFLKDAYQRPEVVTIHEEITDQIATLEKNAQIRLSALNEVPASNLDRSTRILIAIAGGILFLVSLIFLRNFLVYLRPLKKLHRYAVQTMEAAGQLDIELPKGLSHAHHEIAQALRDTIAVLSGLRKERQKFIQDIVHDLKAPLLILQKHQQWITGEGAEAFSAGLSLLAGSLGDLEDLTHLNMLAPRIQEKTVDLSDVISEVSQKVISTQIAGNVRVTVPSLPIWVRIDSDRFERVMVQLFSKLVEVLPPRQEIQASAALTAQGIEITLGGANPHALSGPELDLMKHWVSQQGFGMILAHKIIKAQGGTIHASGIKGMPVTFTVRLPRYRVTDGLISPAEIQPVPSKVKTLKIDVLTADF